MKTLEKMLLYCKVRKKSNTFVSVEIAKYQTPRKSVTFHEYKLKTLKKMLHYGRI